MVEARATISTPQMATAPAPAMTSTRWRSIPRSETVESRNRSMPARSTTATGHRVFNCQFTRIDDTAALSSTSDAGCIIVCRLARQQGGSPSGVRMDAACRVSLRGGDAASCVSTPVSRIGMQSREQVGHSEEGEHHDPKSQDGKVGCPAAAPAARDPHMKVASVHQPGDGCPGLLGSQLQYDPQVWLAQ